MSEMYEAEFSRFYGLSEEESAEYKKLSKIDLRIIGKDDLDRYKELAQKMLSAIPSE